MKSVSTHFLFFVTFFIVLSGCSTTTIYLVRHAEKGSTPANDPPLTVQGQQRAQTLADSLRSKNITAIYSTNTVRTRTTAEPLATVLRIPIRPYSPDTLWETARHLIKVKGGNVLVVGHSNTILPLLDQFPVLHKEKEIPDSDYDNLYRVKVERRFLLPKRVTLTEGTYGAKTE